MAMDVPSHIGEHEGPAVAYVRAHDVLLARINTHGSSIQAVVSDVHPIGALVRLELDRVDSDGIIEAELTRERYDELKLHEGESAFVTARNLRVFLNHN